MTHEDFSPSAPAAGRLMTEIVDHHSHCKGHRSLCFGAEYRRVMPAWTSTRERNSEIVNNPANEPKRYRSTPLASISSAAGLRCTWRCERPTVDSDRGDDAARR